MICIYWHLLAGVLFRCILLWECKYRGEWNTRHEARSALAARLGLDGKGANLYMDVLSPMMV